MLTKYMYSISRISQSADLGFGPTNLNLRRDPYSEIVKRHPPVLHVFFSSACRILLDLWTFSPVRARALLEKFSVQYITARTMHVRPVKASLSKRQIWDLRDQPTPDGVLVV